MKKIVSIIVLVVLLLSINIQPQIITQQQKDSIITDLYSAHWATVDYAKDGIVNYKIYESIPVLQSEIWNKDNQSRLSFVKAMLGLELESTKIYAIALFDSLTKNSHSENDTIMMKLDLIKILFELNDFSKIGYLNYHTNPANYKVYNFQIIGLWSYLLHIPEYEQIAKEKLLIYLSESLNGSERSLSLYFLGQKFKIEIAPLVINRFSEESDFAIKYTILKEYFPLGDPAVVSNILKENLITTNNSSMQRAIILYLLDSLSTPTNFYYLNNWLGEAGGDLRLKMTMNIMIKYGNKGNAFIPDPLTSIHSIIDSTYSYVIQSQTYTWLSDLTFSNELKNILTTAKTNLQNGDSLVCRVQVKAFQDLVDNVYKDSLNSDARFVTIEGWKFLYWNAQYILDRLPEPQANPNLLVTLKNSLGNQIPASNVTYYENSWKDAVNNGDGTFTVITTKPTVSIRVYYEYANQTVNNVTAQNNTYTFQTVNAAVELRNSSGNFIDVGTVQYYAGAWRSFGTTTNGVAYKELLPINYSFRMTYEYVPNDKQQDISVNSTVTFTTVLCTVKVTNTNNQPLAGASTKYYSTAWRDIGLTNSEGVITKELLPKNLSFRASYGNVTKDKQQDIGVNNLVEIQLNIQ